TRDLNLGKVALYQLSYSRAERNRTIQAEFLLVKLGPQKFLAYFESVAKIRHRLSFFLWCD
ncbi:hypothetical protein, partial [Turicimonas muris]|uniref:hypothetical protein n=1 Tax=Turicimonas muris TaxID=1796652 RepID=UPI00259924D6